MSSWNWWDYIVYFFNRVRRRIKDAFYSFKYRCQRFIRGYSDEDVFEFAYNLKDHIEKILKDFIECHSGYVGDEEEYDKKLKDMLYHLEWMDEQKISNEIFDKYKTYFPEYYKEINDTLEFHTEEFFKLFKEMYWTLWD